MTARSPLVWALLALVCILFSGVAFSLSRLETVAREAKVASRQANMAAVAADRGLCAIRSTDQRLLRQTAVYLRNHPDGLPALHLSRAAILRSEAPLIAQVKALRDVRCPS